MSIEFVCLVGYSLRLYHAWAFMPKWRHWKDRKILIVLACLFVRFFSFSVLFSMVMQLSYIADNFAVIFLSRLAYLNFSLPFSFAPS